MIHNNKSDWLELEACLRALEQTLVKLDDAGAGIAAIHVDAAIHHLNGNLKAIEEATLVDSDAVWLDTYADQQLMH